MAGEERMCRISSHIAGDNLKGKGKLPLYISTWQACGWKVTGCLEELRELLVTGECFLVEVKHRDAATLFPLIQQCIHLGLQRFRMEGIQ